MLAAIIRLFLFPPTLSHTQKQDPYRNEAITFLRYSQIKGKMFNPLEDGGYFIWFDPKRPVFMDGRLDIYTGTGIYDDYRKIYQFPPEKDWQEVLEKYQIDSNIVRGHPSFFEGSSNPS